ncbi:DUF4386 family protein [Alteromonas flava]|uniref:DUF4386 family protein n=1 Tax=Alteromonas flava TaxID=2048003 RepID=UPI000C285572|nr:DUF4386 family protein [Alteromonas flava]
MKLLKWGGLAALTEATTYLVGFALFFGVLNTSQLSSADERLAYLLQHQDSYFLGYLVIGVLFSFALIALVQALYQRMREAAPQVMQYSATVGYIWAGFVLASSFIFLTSLTTLTNMHPASPENALLLHQTLAVVISALGGGIELIGAVWVLIISVVGLRSGIYSRWLHLWGLVVALAGILTLFAGLEALRSVSFFELTTALFGLGQILWFIGLGIAMLRDPQED